MQRSIKKVTQVTETQTITLTDKDIENVLREHFQMQGAEVDFDVRHGEYLAGATLTLSAVSTTEE